MLDHADAEVSPEGPSSISTCPGLFRLASGRDGPDGLDQPLADPDDLIMQMHRRIGIADDEGQPIADFRRLAGL